MALDIITQPEIKEQAAQAMRQAYAEPQQVEIMDKTGVCIVLIHQGMIHYRTALWLDAQRQAGVQIVCHTEQALLTHENGMVEKYLNCSAARNNARSKALETEAKWFMFLDADVVPPINAIDHFLLQKTPVRGGWYPIKETRQQVNTKTKDGKFKVQFVRRWVAGRWVADNVLYNYMQPHTLGLYPSDVLPAGCCMMDREIAEIIEFEHGTDVNYRDQLTGLPCILGECGIFGNRLHELGETVWMNPAVICDHESFS